MKKSLSAALAAGVLATGLVAPVVHADPPGRNAPQLRFATFNASLNRNSPGQLEADLSTGDNAQASAVAEVIQRTRPDVVLINEFDHVEGNRAVDAFRENYLQVDHNGASAIEYPYAFTAPVNTGVDSGHDLNRNGILGEPDDAKGFGAFPGQYGMVVLSKYPIKTDEVRTFTNFKWADMPDAMLPDDPATTTPKDWYSPEVLADLPLSSKSHWDIPVQIGAREVHTLVSHPTPPSFDGAEDRNGTRNHDEIRFWADYITPGAGGYIYDDNGGTGGLSPRESFVIMGDQNSDPNDGDSAPGAIQQLLDNHRLVDPMPTSEGAPEAATKQGGANTNHVSQAAYDTADFSDDPTPGNLRTDYVLPSRKGLLFTDSRVFWPKSDDPLSRLTGEYPFPTSDHRMVWLDLRLTGRPA